MGSVRAMQTTRGTLAKFKSVPITAPMIQIKALAIWKSTNATALMDSEVSHVDLHFYIMPHSLLVVCKQLE